MKKYTVNIDRIVWRNIDKEAVILNLDTGFYYTLNEVGTLVWQLLDNNKDINKIINQISQDYNISIKRAEKDVNSLLGDLRKEKLILAKK
jgi:hypothetical protein